MDDSTYASGPECIQCDEAILDLSGEHLWRTHAALTQPWSGFKRQSRGTVVHLPSPADRDRVSRNRTGRHRFSCVVCTLTVLWIAPLPTTPCLRAAVLPSQPAQLLFLVSAVVKI
jgi:hypothetical protein